MFSVCVSTSFQATHAVTIQGVDETPHSHDWKVEAILCGDSLDDDNVLIDFLEVEKKLDTIVSPFRDSDLNNNPMLEGANPSTEYVAMYIGEQLKQQIHNPIRVQSVTVTEAANCKATYVP